MGCALLSEAPMNQSKTISTRSCSKSFTWNLGLSILDTSVAKSFTSKAPVLLLKVYHLRKQHPSPNCLSSKNNSLPFFFFFNSYFQLSPQHCPPKYIPNQSFSPLATYYPRCKLPLYFTRITTISSLPVSGFHLFPFLSIIST